MKQHISFDQFKELPHLKQSELFDWMLRHGYAKVKDKRDKRIPIEVVSEMDLPTIGQMIEFLNENKIGKFEMGIKECWFVDIDLIPMVGLVINQGELCDALWKAVKQVLEK